MNENGRTDRAMGHSILSKSLCFLLLGTDCCSEGESREGAWRGRSDGKDEWRCGLIVLHLSSSSFSLICFSGDESIDREEDKWAAELLAMEIVGDG